MSGIELNSSFSPFTLEALNNDIVVETIVSHLGDNHHDLTKYRFVCHKWNDAIVRKIKKSAPSLHIPLRYGLEIPLFIHQSEASRLAKEILESVLTTLTGTASRLQFDAVVVDRDFYLAGVKAQWTDFLEIHGQFIRHLKFKIRTSESTKLSENHVTDCEEIVSMEDLVETFTATPNLESLYFSIRFSNYLAEPVAQPNLMDVGHVRVLHKLTNITIREPKGISYSCLFIKQILRMAPNLTSFCIKPSSVLHAYVRAMKSIKNQLKGSLTSLKISNAHFPDLNYNRGMLHFPYLSLTTLELNNIHGVRMHNWIERLLHAHRSSLIKLILGDQKNEDSHPLVKVTPDMPLNLVDSTFFELPPVMEHLKILEVNLSKFLPFLGESYQILFPVLESFTLSGARENGNEWTLDHLAYLLHMHSGRSDTLKQFSLIGPIHEMEQEEIILGVRVTFPLAECHFHSESDNQYSHELESFLPLV